MKPLSPTMAACLDHARAHGFLIRYNGGFWAGPGAECNWNGVPQATWFAWGTIEALVSRGQLRVSERNVNAYASRVEPTTLA